MSDAGEGGSQGGSQDTALRCVCLSLFCALYQALDQGPCVAFPVILKNYSPRRILIRIKQGLDKNTCPLNRTHHTPPAAPTLRPHSPRLQALELPELPPHARYVFRSNECYDWGTFGLLLRGGQASTWKGLKGHGQPCTWHGAVKVQETGRCS